ncbi:MAG: hypothetical protein GY929_09020 [Actinomycetia bacterium]|nr:hypothetical protein [Actinomycetes bacterium]
MSEVRITGPGLQPIIDALGQGAHDLESDAADGAGDAAGEIADAMRRQAPVGIGSKGRPAGRTRRSVKAELDGYRGRARAVAGGRAARWVYVPIVDRRGPRRGWVARAGRAGQRAADVRVRRWVHGIMTGMERRGGGRGR